MKCVRSALYIIRYYTILHRTSVWLPHPLTHLPTPIPRRPRLKYWRHFNSSCRLNLFLLVYIYIMWSWCGCVTLCKTSSQQQFYAPFSPTTETLKCDGVGWEGVWDYFLGGVCVYLQLNIRKVCVWGWLDIHTKGRIVRLKKGLYLRTVHFCFTSLSPATPLFLQSLFGTRTVSYTHLTLPTTLEV